MQKLISNEKSGMKFRSDGTRQEAGGVGAAVTGLETSKADRDDRRMLRALSLKSLGEMEDSGRGHGVANILEPAEQWPKLRTAMGDAVRIAAPRALINRASVGMRGLNASSQFLDSDGCVLL